MTPIPTPYVIIGHEVNGGLLVRYDPRKLTDEQAAAIYQTKPADYPTTAPWPPPPEKRGPCGFMVVEVEG